MIIATVRLKINVPSRSARPDFSPIKDNQDAKTSFEVLETHLGLKDAEANAHLAKYFDEVWNHHDVLNKGSLEAIELNHFMRDLCRPIKDPIYLE